MDPNWRKGRFTDLLWCYQVLYVSFNTRSLWNGYHTCGCLVCILRPIKFYVVNFVTRTSSGWVESP